MQAWRYHAAHTLMTTVHPPFGTTLDVHPKIAARLGRLRGVRDARYRYIRNFTPEVPFLAPNNYKETQYPVWNLLKELHAAGNLTPPQEFLCQPRQPAEELYDLASDPHELHNLANSTAPADVAELKKLRAALEHWIVETDDQGRFPEVNPPKTAAEAAGPAAGKNKKK